MVHRMLTEGVDYGGTICGIVIMAVSIVIQADLQRPYDLLDIVVVRPEVAIIYISCQLGHMRESIVHRMLTNWIGVLYVVEHGGAVYQGGGVDWKTQEGYPYGSGKADMDSICVVGDSGI